MATYIEREAVRERACSGCTRRIGKDGCGYEEPCERLIAEFVCAPAADVVEVRRGKWVEADDGDGVVCSVCGEDFCTIIHETDRFKYCPNCGCRMDKDGE